MKLLLAMLLLPLFLFSEMPVQKHLKNIGITNYRTNFDSVSCIYVINLDERPEKWNRIQSIFSEKQILINRVPAINGWKLSTEVQRELFGSTPVRLRAGEIGCLLSHLSVLQDAYLRGFELIWVLEDDIEFLDDVFQLPEILRKLSEIDPEWDVFYTDIDAKNESGQYVPSLGSDFRQDRQNLPLSYFLERKHLDTNIMRINQRFGAYSLLLSKRGIEKILDYFTHEYLYTAYDIDIHYIPNIRQYSVIEDIVSVSKATFSDTYNYAIP